MSNYNEYPRVIVKGHVLVTDQTTGEVILDKSNAIHPENLSYALATAISNRVDVNETGISSVLGQLKYMAFGRGGSTTSAGTGKITYLRPNTVGDRAALYQQTYQKLIDDNDPLMNPVSAVSNNIRVTHVPGNLFSDVVITCTLDANEPSGQSDLDNSSESESDFIFDEIGLIDSNDRLLTHIVFHPVQKSLNRILQVKYSIRIQLI